MMKTNKMATEFNKSNVILRQNEVSTNNENTCKHKKPTLMQATQINKKQKEIVEDESKTER